MHAWASARRTEEDIASRRRLYVLALVLFVVGEGLSALDVVHGSHVEFAAFTRGGNALLIISLVAGFCVFLATGPTRAEVTGALALGAVFEATQLVWRVSQHQNIQAIITNAGGGFGIAGLVVCIASTWRARGEDQRRCVWRLTAIALFPTFMFLSRILVDLTVTLHPRVWDPTIYVADECFGFAPAFAIAGLLKHPLTHWIHYVFLGVYFTIPLAAAVIQIQQLRHPERSRDDIGLAFIVAGIVGGTLFNVVPTLGPIYLFGNLFPLSPPDPSLLPLPAVVFTEGHRNGIPSLHTTWGLLIYWQSKPHAKWVRVFAATFLTLTLIATMTTGEHYLVDLIVSVPFAVALNAALTRSVPLRARERWMPLAAGAAYFVGWSAMFLGASSFFLSRPEICVGLYVFTVLPPLVLQRELARAAREAPVAEVPSITPRALRAPLRAHTAIVAMFFASGFAGLIYEVTFAKSLALVFGSTATAATTVLATYMGGMSLGSWIGGRLASRARSPLKMYALCEAGVALTCAASPWLVGALRTPYVALAHGIDPGAPSLVAIQVLLGALLLLPPTLLMGMTLPLLTRRLESEHTSLGESVGSLYGANTLGAAAGALVTGYLLLQVFGVLRTTLIAVALNLAVVFVALRWAARSTGESENAANALEGAPRDLPALSALSPRVPIVGFVVLGVGGVVTLALEGLYTHLLAVVVGNSVFAFAAMLCCFLVGLGAGSSMGRAWLRRGLSPVLGVGLAQALVASAVLVGVFGWDLIPSYFGSFAVYPHTQSFASREFVRFVVCALEMVPPALFIGASFPLAMECVGRGSRERAAAVGRAAAVNTLGNIVGALVGGFVLLPRFGSLHALQLLACVSLALAVMVIAVATARERRWLSLPIAAAAAVLFAQPRSFDLTRLSTGSNVYFRAQGFGTVIDSAESADGGLTTVARAANGIKTLLTNGKFQGNDARSGELAAQVSFPLFPLLHTTQRSNALVIGFGTGTSARVASDGFQNVDIAELSADVAHLSDRHFASINDHVLERPNVHLHVTDGRNYLLVEPRRYDLIAIEITSIWFAGAASLYDTDFYRLVASRLAPGGVLQQWVQLHHLTPSDDVAIFASLRSVFAKVWLYEAGNQGIVVACLTDCEPTDAALAMIDAQPALKKSLALLGGGARALLAMRVLTPEAVDRFLAEGGVTPDTLANAASTDDNLLLEYSTPRGNARSDELTVANTMRMLTVFKPQSELDGTHIAARP